MKEFRAAVIWPFMDGRLTARPRCATGKIGTAFTYVEFAGGDGDASAHCLRESLWKKAGIAERIAFILLGQGLEATVQPAQHADDPGTQHWNGGEPEELTVPHD